MHETNEQTWGWMAKDESVIYEHHCCNRQHVGRKRLRSAEKKYTYVLHGPKTDDWTSLPPTRVLSRREKEQFRH